MEPIYSVNQYQCPGCRADMIFEPEVGQLQCPYCGRVEDLPKDTATTLRSTLQEHHLESFTHKNRTQIAQLSTTAQEVKCPGCQAIITFEPPDVAGQCPFCATSIVTQTPQPAAPTLAPSALVPFALGRKVALTKLRDWLAFRWDRQDLKALFLPGQLTQLAQNEGLIGVYLPFWTYDTQAETSYRGERGEYYYTTETYRTQDASGKTVTKTRRVRHTRWHSVSGHVSRFFDDILVPATQSVKREWLTQLWATFSATALKPYHAEYLAGFKAQRYTIPVKEGFEQAKATTVNMIRQDVTSDIGGDDQRIHGLDTSYLRQTFKHILLPVWMVTYRYGDKTYQVMINAKTGKVIGERPLARWKLALTAAIATSLIAVIVIVIQMNG